MMYTHLSIYSKVLYKYRPYELNMLQMLQENNKTEYLCPRFFVTGHESTCTFEFEECWESWLPSYKLKLINDSWFTGIASAGVW